jgi:transglutaminase-like putative cysteine protease
MVMWLSRLLAIALCAAAIDVAVATLHGAGSALAIAVGAAALCVVSIALFWTRPSIAAALSFLWLTAAFCASAILVARPDMPGGVAFTGLSATDSVTLVLTVALAAAGLLGIVTFRQPVVQVILVLVTAYAVVPMALSVGHGGLSAALTSGPLAALRGAYVGVAALFPLAAVVALGTAIFLVAKRRGAQAATALILSVAMAAAYETGGAFGHGSSATQASEQETGDTVARVIETVAPEDFNLAARAKRLPTVEAAFGYVRDTIGFEPYSGVLRGPEGTFLTRAGNAPDRATLLARILQANNISVRYATGRLPQTQAELLFARAFETRPRPAPRTAAASAAATTLHSRIVERANHDYNLMRSALGNELPAAAVTSHDDAVKEIQQHAWVQAQVHGQWVDLDPSLADSKVGQTYTTVDQTYTTLPDTLAQHVTIRVKTESLRDGALVKDVPLEVTVPAYQLLDGQVFFSHTPVSGLGAVFASKDRFVPVLFLNGDPQAGKEIAFAGASRSATPPPSAVEGAVSAFGGSTAKPGTALVSEALEFTVTFPDGHTDSTTRMLIDRASAAWRRASPLDSGALKELPSNKDGLIATQTVYNVCFSAGKHNVPAYARGMLALMGGEFDRPADGKTAPPSFTEQTFPLAMRDFAWFVVSDHIVVPSLNDVPGLRFYADSPRIFVFGIAPNPAGGSASVTMDSDFRGDTLRALARDSSAQAAVAEHRLRFGALEGALEHELGVASPSLAADSVESTSGLAESGGVTVFRPGSSGAASARDPETADRIKTALAAGDTLIVPNRVLSGGAPGWWQISHGNGDAHSMMDDLGGWKGSYGGTSGGPKSSVGGYRPGGKTWCIDPQTCGMYRPQRPPPPRAGGSEYAQLLVNAVIMVGGFVGIGLQVYGVVSMLRAILDALQN